MTLDLTPQHDHPFNEQLVGKTIKGVHSIEVDWTGSGENVSEVLTLHLEDTEGNVTEFSLYSQPDMGNGYYTEIAGDVDFQTYVEDNYPDYGTFPSIF